MHIDRNLERCKREKKHRKGKSSQNNELGHAEKLHFMTSHCNAAHEKNKQVLQNPSDFLVQPCTFHKTSNGT